MGKLSCFSTAWRVICFSFCAMNHFLSSRCTLCQPSLQSETCYLWMWGLFSGLTTFTDCSSCSFRDWVMWWPWSEAASGAAPGQRDRMSGQVCARCCEFRNVSVCGWVYVRACVCAKGKVDINNLCCIYFYLLLSPPCGSVFMLFLKICLAPWIVRGFDWMRWIQNRQILQSDINCTQNVLISMSIAASGSVVPVPNCISVYVLTLRFKKLKKYDIHVFIQSTIIHGLNCGLSQFIYFYCVMDNDFLQCKYVNITMLTDYSKQGHKDNCWI